MAEMPKYYKIHTDGHDVALEPIYSELVPVVRCKDCKHVQTVIDGRLICGAMLNRNWVSKDHFCSCGERGCGDG